MRTLGIIGGVTWHASVEYYRLINEAVHRELGGQHSARLVMYSVEFDELRSTQLADGWPAVLKMLKEIACGLKAAGAEGLLLGANTLHILADDLEGATGLPVIHIADAVGAAARDAGLSRLGLLGTDVTMAEPFYRERLAARWEVEVMVPEEPQFTQLSDLIYDDLVKGRFEDAGRDLCLGIMEDLVARGAEGMILGCTELPILLEGRTTPVPGLDTLELHAEAAARWSLG